MLVFATRLPYSSAQKSVKMRDRLLQRSDEGRAPDDGTRALTESGQQVAARVRGIDCDVGCVARSELYWGEYTESQLQGISPEDKPRGFARLSLPDVLRK